MYLPLTFNILPYLLHTLKTWPCPPSSIFPSSELTSILFQLHMSLYIYFHNLCMFCVSSLHKGYTLQKCLQSAFPFNFKIYLHWCTQLCHSFEHFKFYCMNTLLFTSPFPFWGPFRWLAIFYYDTQILLWMNHPLLWSG